MCNIEIDMGIFFDCDQNGMIMCTQICNLVAGYFSVLGDAKSIISQLSFNWAVGTDTQHILSSEHLFFPFSLD